MDVTHLSEGIAKWVSPFYRSVLIQLSMLSHCKIANLFIGTYISFFLLTSAYTVIVEEMLSSEDIHNFVSLIFLNQYNLVITFFNCIPKV